MTCLRITAGISMLFCLIACLTGCPGNNDNISPNANSWQPLTADNQPYSIPQPVNEPAKLEGTNSMAATPAPDIRSLYNTTREKIAEIRANVNLEENPAYRVAVKETARTITLSREPYSITFDRKSAMVRSAVIDGVKLDEVMLPHLLIIDENGKPQKQSESTAGELRVRHEKFSLFLEGYFTICGRRVPVVYEMDRMTGTTFCTMDVPGPLKVRRLTLEHSLGRTPRPLDTFYAPHHYLKTFKPYKPTVINEHRPDVIFEKDTMMFWTDGHIGMQVYSITWDKSKVLPAEKKYIYGTGEIRDGASWADLTFISTGTKESMLLPDGYRATCAFSPMPYKKWRPLSDIASSDCGFAPKEAPGYERGAEIAAGLKRFGQAGTTLLIHNQPHPCFVPLDPDFTRWQADEARRNGMKMILYIERSWAREAAHPKSGLLTEEELLNGRQELKSHWGDKDGGAGRWGDLLTMCCNYEPWRIHLLTMCDYYVGTLGFDGIYLDTSFICSCQNTRHGESPDESTSVRGSMIFQQDLRLLMDDYARRNGRPYIIINHYWDQHAAPVAGVIDYTLPGEQDANKMMKTLTPQNFAYGYSAIPNGVNSMWYTAGTYDYTCPQIYNDAAECGGMMFAACAPNTVGMMMHVRHNQPAAQYGLEGSTPVHRFSADYDKLFTGGDSRTRAMMYIKDDSAMVFLINDGPKSKNTSFSFRHPRASWKKCLVLDAANMTWQVVDAKRGRIEMSGLDCSEGPLPMIVRPYPTQVGLNWFDNQTRSVKVEVSGTQVTVTARGVAESVSACYLEAPEGIQLTRMGVVIGKVNPNIFCLSLAYDRNGRAMQILEISKVPVKPKR